MELSYGITESFCCYRLWTLIIRIGGRCVVYAGIIRAYVQRRENPPAAKDE